MFSFLVMLKKEPWYIYSADEKDALKICEQFKDNVVGVIDAESFEVKMPKLVLSLKQEVVLNLPVPSMEEQYKNLEASTDEDLEEDKKEFIKDLENEFKSGIIEGSSEVDRN